MQTKRIVVLGGGTGSFTLLQSLKGLSPKITAIVNMCDDGGSTGVLRDELGVLPPGDARQCLVALSERPEIRELFDYRFDGGRLSGQSLGNIILSGLELQHGSFEKAVEVASRILRIRGHVVPVVLGDHKLVMDDGGKEVVGQFNIRNHVVESEAPRVRLEPVTTLNPKANRAIRKADIVVIAPGGLYYSLLPIFSVNGMKEALQGTSAQVVCVSNLIERKGRAESWHVVDHVKTIEEYVGEGTIDVVLYNNAPLEQRLIERYAAEADHPVLITPDRFTEIGCKAVGAPLISPTLHVQDAADKAIQRTLIRHDADRVSEEIAKFLTEK